MPQPDSAFLTVRNLVKRFGSHTALPTSRWISALRTGVPAGPGPAGRPRCRAPSPAWNARSGAIKGRAAIFTPSPRARLRHPVPVLLRCFPNLTGPERGVWLERQARPPQPRRHRVDGDAEPGRPDWGRGQIIRADFRRPAAAWRALAPSSSLLLLDEPMSALTPGCASIW